MIVRLIGDGTGFNSMLESAKKNSLDTANVIESAKERIERLSGTLDESFGGGVFESVRSTGSSTIGKILEVAGAVRTGVGKALADSGQSVEKVKEEFEGLGQVIGEVNEQTGVLSGVLAAVAGSVGTVFSPMTILVLGVAAAVTALVSHLGGWAKVWEMVQERAVAAWTVIKAHIQAFYAWVEPVVLDVRDLLATMWEAAKQVAAAAWEFMKAGFAIVRDFVLSVWAKISGSAVVDWEKVKDTVRDAIQFVEFSIQNFGQVVQFVWTMIRLGWTVVVEEIKHFFTGTLPAFLSWFSENWRDVFQTAWDFAKTVFVNMANNIVVIIKAAWEEVVKAFKAAWEWIAQNGPAILSALWEGIKTAARTTWQFIAENVASVWGNIKGIISGALGFDDVWKTEADNAAAVIRDLPEKLKNTNFGEVWRPLTEGFKSSIKDLPKIPERQMSEAERALRKQAQEQAQALQEGFAEFQWEKEFWRSMQESDENWDDFSFGAEEAAADAGQALSQELRKGAARGVENLDAVLVGSAEAVARLADFRESRRTSGTSQDDRFGTRTTGSAGATAGGAGRVGQPAGGTSGMAEERNMKMVEILTQIRDLIKLQTEQSSGVSILPASFT